MDKQIESGSVNPRNIKMRLAHMITEEYHGKDGADKAQEDFINVVSNKGIPDDIEDVKIDAEINILDLLLKLNFVQSKGEAKRLIQGGGVKLDGEKVSDASLMITPEMNKVLQAGKRKFAKLV
jgi:tyrosyl-tRNA synthetase